MAGISAIQGVDDTLRGLSTQAVSGINPPASITVGPLDREDDRLRLNWFLYQIAPNPGSWNMEPPQTGWRTARGRPPLSLQLHYLLSAHPGPLTTNGDEDQFAHRALAAVMRALHSNAVIGEGDPALSNLARPLVEPLRITLDVLDLESIAKVWTAASQPLRLSVGYRVSLVVVDSLEAHAAGPPVRERRVAVAPTMGPKLVSVTPDRIAAALDFTVAASGLTAGATFTLARVNDDPAGPPGGWPLTVVAETATTVTLRLADATPVAGERRLDVTAAQDGLLLGRDSIGVSVVPRIGGHAGTVTAGSTVQLTTAHAGADVEVFLGGARVPPGDVAFVSPTQVDVTLPVATPLGPLPASLRSAKLAGPVYEALAVVP